MNLPESSRKRLAEILRAKFARVCTNVDLVASVSDEDLIAQAERHHAETEARHRARAMSMAVHAALAGQSITRTK